MKTDFYFTTTYSENEHTIVESMLARECTQRNILMAYYRKLKTGHVPCYRECKILAPQKIVVKMLKDLDIKWGNYFARAAK